MSTETMSNLHGSPYRSHSPRDAELRGAELRVENISVRAGDVPLLTEASLSAQPGEVLGIIGPNGSGKSTLLRALFHSQRPTSGSVLLNGENIWERSISWCARHIAVVLQEAAADFPLCCREIVAMGRAPHHSAWDGPSPRDRALCAAAMRAMGVEHLASAPFSQLSGGERQRVHIARALSQQAGLLLMDEPTNHLDISHQIVLMRLACALPSTVVVVLHDMNLAARFCNRLVLLARGRVVAEGTPDEVLQPNVIDPVYGIHTVRSTHPDGSVQLAVLS